MKSTANLYEVYPRVTHWVFDDDLKARRKRLYSSGYDAYCHYVPVGYEMDAAVDINNYSSSFIATPFMRTKHRSNNGVRTLEKDILLDGYVFLFAPHGTHELRITEFKYVCSKPRKMHICRTNYN